MGRKTSDIQEFDTSKLKEAADAAAKALEPYLGSEAAERFKGLLESSNRPSFKTLVGVCLDHVPEIAIKQVCGDAETFTKMVAKTRHALTHMRDKKGFSLDQASRTALYLTYKLSVLFCVLEAQLLGLPLDSLPTMLANNDVARTARRPIPI